LYRWLISWLAWPTRRDPLAAQAEVLADLRAARTRLE
jgi:hypothetical protein